MMRARLTRWILGDETELLLVSIVPSRGSLSSMPIDLERFEMLSNGLRNCASRGSFASM